jgi:hypothetical protein
MTAVTNKKGILVWVTFDCFCTLLEFLLFYLFVNLLAGHYGLYFMDLLVIFL